MNRLFRKFIVTGEMILLVTGSAFGMGWAQIDSKSATGGWKAPARAAHKKNPIPSDPPSIALGKSVYIQECLSCHGVGGKGDGPQVKDLERPVGDLSDPKILEESDGALFWKIAEGRKPMPTFERKLTEEERWHVINYIRTFSREDTGGKQLKRGEEK